MANADLNKGIVAGTQDTPTTEKPDRSLLVELKNGKLVFKQKALSFEKMSETMQEIVRFREMLEDRLSSKQPPLNAVPDEHKPVIAKLAHESDKTLQALSKYVQQELSPPVDEDEEENNAPAILPLDTIEDAVKSLARRVNYGLDSPTEGGKVPAAWSIWRWEVKECFRGWLPKAAREKVDNRFRERQQLKCDVQTLFDSLPEDERVAILGTKVGRPPGKTKGNTRDLPVTNAVDVSSTVLSVPSEEPLASSENDPPSALATEEDASDKKGPGRPKKPVDPEKAAEKAAKEKERQEKKAAKAEREKKEKDAQAKSRSLMANFFGKARAAGVASPSKLKTTAQDAERSSPGPVVTQSDFEKTFRPFAIKKDAELAPENWFRECRRRNQHSHRTVGNVIVIDDDEDLRQESPVHDVEMVDSRELDASKPDARLCAILARLSRGLNPPRRPRQPTGYKTYNPISVRGLMTQLTEAEVAGDDGEVRRLLALLRDRGAIPAKVLIFDEDARPGYFGTFTRNSREVGPRAPFARDVVQVDYTYDSGEEWAEEEGEADDVVEDADEDGDGEEEPDSDMDSWLVDDDEAEDPGTPIEERMSSPGFPDLDMLPSGSGSGNGKRKAKEREKTGSGKKRRIVIPLVPFSKGPEWETAVGRCTYEPFNAYRIQLFNDTPFPIDPFKFVSHPTEQQAGVPQGQSHTADGFVIPALPPHLAHPAHASSSSAASTSHTLPPAVTPKRGVPAPRTAFPDAHLPHLLSCIDTLATSSLQGIVEAVHRELQVHKVKKNAIEAKIREVSEKCKERKVWVVKPGIRAQQGLS